MRRMITGVLAIASAVLVCGPAKADYVSPFKGNDTGGIISYSLTSQTDIKALAINHCAQYDKIVKLTGVQPYYGGYISFACIWGPPAQRLQLLNLRY